MNTKACADCNRLWSAYQAATLEQFKMEGKLQIAGYAGDHDSVKRITPEVDAAAERRGTLRGDSWTRIGCTPRGHSGVKFSREA